MEPCQETSTTIQELGKAMIGEAKYLYQHPCEKPDMIVEPPVWKEHGLLKRLLTGADRRIVKHAVYEDKRVIWKCPVCKSSWEWCPMPIHGGYWRADRRTNEWRKYNG